ncbi:MAG: hypothetical protein WBA12_00085, partial [Catalinimonas sp.]
MQSLNALPAVTPQHLIDYFYQEAAAAREAQREGQLLTPEGLALEGRLLAGLRLRTYDAQTAHFGYGQNLTRFKVGDQVILTDGTQRHEADLVDFTADGLELRARYGNRFTDLRAGASWWLEEPLFDVGWRVVKLVRERLRPGGAGWGWFST